jgi:hypothetical protein
LRSSRSQPGATSANSVASFTIVMRRLAGLGSGGSSEAPAVGRPRHLLAIVAVPLNGLLNARSLEEGCERVRIFSAV